MEEFRIPPKGEWTRLTGTKLLDYLRDNMLIGKKHYKAVTEGKEPLKRLDYQEVRSQVWTKCDVVGYVDKITTVISIDGDLSCIHPEYLREMQSAAPKGEDSPAKDLPGGNYFVIDVETPNGKGDRVCSVGITIIKGGSRGEARSILVNPETYFTARNIKINGIHESDVVNAPTFPTVWANEIEPYADDGYIFVAHKASFDFSVLRKALRDYGLQAPRVQYIDTLEMAKAVYPNLPQHKLNYLCKQFNIPLQHHRAESDSYACAALLIRMIRQGHFPETYIHTYDFADFTPAKSHKKSRGKTESHMQYSETTLALRELSQLVSSAIADDVLTLDEITKISAWMDEHKSLEGNYPFDRIFDALQKALASGTLAQSVLQELKETLAAVDDPLEACCATVDALPISGKNVCLTGEFDSMSRAEVKTLLESYGAKVKNTVSKTLDYPVVGGQGSSAWAAGNYGSKVKRALELQQQGASIQIIRETDFFPNLVKGSPAVEEPEGEAEILEPTGDKAVDACFSAVRQALSAEGYSLTNVSFVFRTPKKGEPYYAIEFFKRSAFTIKGKKKRSFQIQPQIADAFAEFNLVAPKHRAGGRALDAKDWKRIAISEKTDFDAMARAFCETYEYFLSQSADGFDCCSRYMACSDAKDCVHPDAQFSGGCRYRQKLRRGQIFYGENRNI